MANVSVYIDAAITSISPPETPFDQTGKCTDDRWFIYMTNRSTGRWSYLIAEADTRKDFREFIQMGYTQLWLFKKIYASELPVGSSAPDEKGRNRTFNPSYPKNLERNDWPGRLYVIFREPIAVKYPHGDVIGYRINKETAIRRADQYASNYQRRAIVGLMALDTAWH